MKCPLFVIMAKRTQAGEESDYCECLKEECQLWHRGLEDCRIANLDDSIATIMGTLLSLSLDLQKSGKLPHWRPTELKEELNDEQSHKG